MPNPGLMSKNPLVLLFFLVLLPALYFPALGSGFILDDEYVIVGNPYIRDVASIPRIFTSDIFEFRPRKLGDTSR